MRAFYFTLASLPDLDGSLRPPTPEQFLQAAAVEATDAQVAVLRAALKGGKADDPTLRAWGDFDQRLRYEVARLRSRSLGWEVPPEPPEVSWWLAGPARQAYEKANPLLAEEALDQVRWSWLQERRRGEEFGWVHLVTYALQLALWWKRHARTLERGRAGFEANYRKITQERGVPKP